MPTNRIGKVYKWSEAPHGEATIRVIDKKRTRWIYEVLSKSGPGVWFIGENAYTKGDDGPWFEDDTGFANLLVEILTT